MMMGMTELIHNFQDQIFTPERLLVAMAALAIALIGGMLKGAIGGHATPFLWHILDILFGRLGSRMDKPSRLKGDLIFRGFILAVVILLIGFFIGRFLGLLAGYYTTWSIVEIVSLCLVMVSGSIFVALGQLYKALNDKKVTPGAYFTIARSTRTDLSRNDDYTITRVGMGLALKSFDKGVVAPIFWYLIGGLPVAFIYSALAFYGWRFGRDGHGSGFGEAGVTLEKLMGFIPNMLSGVLIAFAGILTPTAGMTRAFLGLMTTKGAATYGEGGLPMTAAAHSLNVSLGGPTTDLDGQSIKRGWIGPSGATAQLEAKHLHRVLYICFMAHLLFFASLSSMLMFAP